MLTTGPFLFHKNLKNHQGQEQGNTDVVKGAIRPDKHDGGNRLQEGFGPAEWGYEVALQADNKGDYGQGPIAMHSL